MFSCFCKCFQLFYDKQAFLLFCLTAVLSHQPSKSELYATMNGSGSIFLLLSKQIYTYSFTNMLTSALQSPVMTEFEMLESDGDKFRKKNIFF